MFQPFIDSWNAAMEPIRKGNEYRAKMHPPSDLTWKEEIKAAREHLAALQPKCFPFFADSKEIEELEKFKDKFGYWDEWTGARFVRVKNPKPKSFTNTEAVCRFNPVTGYYEASF